MEILEEIPKSWINRAKAIYAAKEDQLEYLKDRLILEYRFGNKDIVSLFDSLRETNDDFKKRFHCFEQMSNLESRSFQIRSQVHEDVFKTSEKENQKIRLITKFVLGKKLTNIESLKFEWLEENDSNFNRSLQIALNLKKMSGTN